MFLFVKKGENMSRELKIAEFEEPLNSRIYMVSLLGHGVVTEKSKLKDLILKYTIATNKTLDKLADYTAGKSKTMFSDLKRGEIYAKHNNG